MEVKQIRAGCGVMIFNNKHELLLGLRNNDREKSDSELHEEGTWTMPGGNIEYGESFEEAGIREAKEEANLNISNLEVICVQTDKNEYAHYVSVGMLAHCYNGIPQVM